MNDIRLEELPFEIDGKRYLLRCNMNVLADVQQEYGGDLSKALEGDSTLKSVTVFLAAMLNDYADEQGWTERWTPRSVGRKFGISGVPTNEIMQLVVRSLTPAGKMSESDTPEAQEDPGNPGN